jgi:chorismate mutase-like protein
MHIEMNPEKLSLKELRQRIDAIDAQVLRLLNDRAGLALQLGQIKQREGLPIHDPDREAALLAQLARTNQGPLDEEAVKEIFVQILRKTRELQLRQNKTTNGSAA